MPSSPTATVDGTGLLAGHRRRYLRRWPVPSTVGGRDCSSLPIVYIHTLFIRNNMPILRLELLLPLIRKLIPIVLHKLKDALNIPLFSHRVDAVMT